MEEDATTTGPPVLVGIARRTEIYVGSGAWFFVRTPTPAAKSHAADRTRSPRWRSGSRRTRRLAAAARSRGHRTLFADPWKGWESLGWTSDETGVPAS